MEQNVIGVEIRWPGGRSDFLHHRVERQLPFAAARALTMLMTRGKDAARRDASLRLHINQKRLLADGSQSAVRGLYASKRDWPNLVARVAVPAWADFMVMHAEGGTRKPRGRSLAFPTRYTLSKRSSTGRIPKAWQPRTLLNERGGYIDQNGALRVQRKRSGDGLARLSIFYHFGPRGVVPPRWRFKGAIAEEVNKYWAPTFQWSLHDALKTANR